MAHRHELTGAEWARIVPLLPARETRGTYYADHQPVRNVMLHRRAGAALAPARFGGGAFGGCTARTVSIRLETNPAGGRLTGSADVTLPGPAATATWSTRSIDTPGTYTLVAVYGASSATS